MAGLVGERNLAHLGQFVIVRSWRPTIHVPTAGPACLNREFVGTAQAGLLRVPLADGTLVATPDIPPNDMIADRLALSDVMGTWFAADAANVEPGKTVAVVGDDAVGLLAVLSAKQMGAGQIIAMSRHEPRQKLAREFGATDIISERGTKE
jgi:threonine dehydrogenase-like Zn-dependent dehydrogenase